MNRLTRTLVRTLAALGATGLALAPSAALAADGTIDHVETKPGTVQLLISVPADADVDLDGVEVTVDGKALGRLSSTGLRPKFLEKMAYANVTVDPLIFAPERG